MDTLFKLIKSLEKGEKRFFRLFAARHVKGKNNSLLLFDAIVVQKTYDEKALKKKFNGTAISKHFAFNKQYLYKMVLRSLHQFHSHSNVEQIIEEQTHYIRILSDRRLLEAADKLIDKTIALAKKHEAYPQETRLWELKMELIAARLFRGYTEKDILQVESEIKKAIANLTSYMGIYMDQRKFYFDAETKGIMLMRDDKTNYLQKTEEVRKRKLEGFRASVYREHFLELANRNLMGDFEVTESNIKKILLLIEQYPHIVKDFPREYLTAVYNYGVHKLYSRDTEKAQELADQLKQFASTTRLSPVLQYASLHFHAILQLGVYRNRDAYAEAEKYFDEFRKKEKRFEWLEPNISREKVIYYVMGCLCFVSGNYKPGIRYLSKITSAKHSNERKDLDDYARILQMLSFFVTGNTLSLETLSRSLRKTFSKKDNLFRIEKLVLDFVMKNNRHIHNKALMKEQYITLLKELRQITANGTNEEKIALEYIDLIKWAEMQIRK